VVDDGSTDGSAEVIAGLDPRIRVIRQTNQGAAAARRAGILAARGKVVAFLDSDDVAKPDHLSALWEGLHRRSDVVLSYARAEQIDGRPSPFERLPMDLDGDGVLLDPLLSLLEIGCFTTSMVLMTYRELALECSAGRGHVLASNDYDLSLRIATRGPFAFVDRYTVRCERRADGISRTRAAMQAGFAVLAACDAVRLSRRRDPGIRRALSGRVGQVWPSAFAQLTREGHLELGLRVAYAGLRLAHWGRSLRRVWWAFAHESSSETGPPSVVTPDTPRIEDDRTTIGVMRDADGS
jgi:glycosyltransferase involved in cell wall biosynthesis